LKRFSPTFVERKALDPTFFKTFSPTFFTKMFQQFLKKNPTFFCLFFLWKVQAAAMARGVSGTGAGEPLRCDDLRSVGR
jgi:hypothetical protein